MKIGQKISFSYHSSDGYKKNRVIEITNLNDHLVTGKTKESDYQDFRSFKRQKMRDVSILSDTADISCNFVRAREKIIDKLKDCNGEELARVFGILNEDTVGDVHFDSKTGSLVYSLLEQEPRVELYLEEGFDFSIVAKDEFGDNIDSMDILVTTAGECLVDNHSVSDLREVCKTVVAFYEYYSD
jgi:hypothetical protein